MANLKKKYLGRNPYNERKTAENGQWEYQLPKDAPTPVKIFKDNDDEEVEATPQSIRDFLEIEQQSSDTPRSSKLVTPNSKQSTKQKGPEQSMRDSDELSPSRYINN